MLKELNDLSEFRKKFFLKLDNVRRSNPSFNEFLLTLMIEHTGYVVGGFLRDIVNDNTSRDIDIIFDIDQNNLIRLLDEFNLSYSINRMKGVKVSLNNFEADIWTVENNWAFKSKVIKKNEDDILNSIASGCFYNYDSIVMNLHKGTVNYKNYNDFVRSRTLDVLRKVDLYKKRNPTLEANVLRALYLQKVYGVNFSKNCKNYLAKIILEINSKSEDPAITINSVKSKYAKYFNHLSYQDIYEGILKLCFEYGIESDLPTNTNQTSLFL